MLVFAYANAVCSRGTHAALPGFNLGKHFGVQLQVGRRRRGQNSKLITYLASFVSSSIRATSAAAVVAVTRRLTRPQSRRIPIALLHNSACTSDRYLRPQSPLRRSSQTSALSRSLIVSAFERFSPLAASFRPQQRSRCRPPSTQDSSLRLFAAAFKVRALFDCKLQTPQLARAYFQASALLQIFRKSAHTLAAGRISSKTAFLFRCSSPMFK